ncbi:MAG: hypothetical protein ACOCRX_05610 [Candidatus Woesearchaeota archaeon]
MKRDIMKVLDEEVEKSKDFDDFVGSVSKAIATTVIAPVIRKFVKDNLEKKLKNIKFWK